jgi:hypothetical protein
LQVTLNFDPEIPALSSDLTITPNTGLSNGQVVQATGSGFAPGVALFILPCAGEEFRGIEEGCDIENLIPIVASGSGEFSVSLVVSEAVVGANCREVLCRYVVANGSVTEIAFSEFLQFE